VLLARILALLSCVALAACSNGGAANDAATDGVARPLVVSSVGPLHDVTAALCGDDFDAHCLLGTGTDPHTYQPTRHDIARLAAADLVIVNGLYLEAPMRATIEALERGGRRVHIASTAVPRDLLLGDTGGHGHADPHLWMDPALWLAVARGIADELAHLRPQTRERVEARFLELEQRFDEIDVYSREVLASIPANARMLVTAHDAFGYWARRYGLEVAAVQGLSTDSETGLARVQELIDLLVAREIPAIFVEESVSARGVEALVGGTAHRGHTVVIGGSLYSDSLGAPGTWRGTYVGMLDHNATVVANALGGSAPLGGRFGRLSEQP
jgi:manganese/zinc/iron transport system substrate-binding protein